MVFDHRTKGSHSPGSAAEAAHAEGAGIRIDSVIESWRAGTVKTIDLIKEGDILAIKYVHLPSPHKNSLHQITCYTNLSIEHPEPALQL